MADTAVVVLEAMKMEHEVLAGADGVVVGLAVAVGDEVEEGQALLTLAPGDGAARGARASAGEQPGGERADLADVHARHALGLDAARPEAVARRHERGAAHGAGEHRRPVSTRGRSTSTARWCSPPRRSGARART